MFLDKIVAQTRVDLEQRKQEISLDEMRRRAIEREGPRDLLEAFSPRTQVHLIAEIKRASPSKGLLAPDLDPVKQAKMYEENGASVISVLTEPHFFLGSPDHLKAIKQTVRIPVLRKDFIFDEYQVYEARSWGADAILLICAILDDEQLHSLLACAHQLRMRCLVEVHSREEAERAIRAGAVIIGVNSRDLVTFKMNPYLLRDIRQSLPTGRIIVAESGIHTAADARRLARYDVQAMLIGESLVVSKDAPRQIKTLLQEANRGTQIKICGLKAPEHINAAIEAGADMLGFIFHEPSHRYVRPQEVKELLVSSASYAQPPEGRSRPDIVGVFVNKDADFINETIEQAGLNYVQLHGTESPEQCKRVKRPIIKSLHVSDRQDIQRVLLFQDTAWRILLDTPSSGWGGSGITHDWQTASEVARRVPIILAGGLTVENVEEALRTVKPWGVDVSSGVETNKQKDIDKIRAFIETVRRYEANREVATNPA